MANSERLVEFELLGQQYKFYTGASEEEMQAILTLVRQLVETEPKATVGTIASGKKAILACLNIASRYVKLQQDFSDYRKATDTTLVQLREKVEKSLEQDD